MVLFSFSSNNHIDLIKTGIKNQTTRIPRKNHSNGKPAYSVGEKVQLYYRSRQKSDCRNCLKFRDDDCYFMLNGRYPTDDKCWKHTNFFGESEIIDLIHYHHGDYKERHHEVWMGYTLAIAGQEDMDAWAIADGFPDGYIQAHDWFKATTGNPNWADQNLDVVVWQKDDIVKRWQQI